MFIIMLISQTMNKDFHVNTKTLNIIDTNKPETAGEISRILLLKYEQGKLLGVFFMWVEQAFIMSLL